MEDALALVQLAGKEARLPHQISGGERQRVGTGAFTCAGAPGAAARRTSFRHSTQSCANEMRVELKNIQRQVGITFLFITHDQEEALSLSDRMAVMNVGDWNRSDTPQSCTANPNPAFVAEFLG